MKEKFSSGGLIWIRLLKMFLTVKYLCFLLLLSMSVSAATYSQDIKLSLSIEDVYLTDIFSMIREKSDLSFVYNVDELRDIRVKSVKVTEASIQDVLSLALKGTGYVYEFEDNVVVIHPKTSEQIKKTLTVNGFIYDENKEPMPGVTVIFVGAHLGTRTNDKGYFSFDLPVEQGQLQFSFIGYKTVKYNFSPKIKSFKITMEQDLQEVEEVVVTGMFNKAKESFTGAATLITKEELMEFKSNNLLSTLSNIDPSFNIISNNEYGSDPNKLPEINIRGTTSIPSNLEDLKAGERANLNTPLFILDEFEISLERMMDLDPDEIQSVTILKDASSTAIYGSRGSNGVVVLTSVKPKGGKLRATVGSSLNLEIPDLSSYNLTNAREKLEIERVAGLYNGKTLNDEITLRNLYSQKLVAIAEGVDTYWLSKPLQTGVATSARLNLSGGDKFFTYRLSTSYNGNTAVMKGSYRNNFNGSLSIIYSKNKLTFSNSVSVGVTSAANSQYGNFSEYARMNPYWEIYDEHGEMVKFFGSDTDKVTGKVNNPLYAAQIETKDETTYTFITNNTNVNWKPIKEVNVQFTAGVSQQISELNRFKPATHVDYEGEDDPRKKGRYDFGYTKSQRWSTSLRGKFAKVYHDKHSVFAGVDVNMAENMAENYQVGVLGFTHERLNFISMGSQYTGNAPSGRESTGRRMGLTTNVSYSYDHMIYFDGSYRIDGASSFGKHGRFKPYYSVGLGWTASRMKFFRDNLSDISTLRFRYSYGVTGSLQFTSPYEAMTVYEYEIGSRYDGFLGATIKGYGNEDLSWQYTYSHNLGMDFSMFKGKFSLGLNVYRRLTEGMTTSMNLPLSHGYETYTENKGDIENKGIDMNVVVKLINRKDFNWSVRGGFARNTNKILKLSEAMKAMSTQAEENGKDDPNYLYREGESMDALYAVPSLGIDPNTGKEVFVDQRGQPTYTWQGSHRMSFGVRQPKLNGRFASSIRYKGFTATASFGVRLGGQIYNSTLISKVESANIKYNVDKRVFTDRWQKPGDLAKFRALDLTSGVRQSSRFVQDESTLEFKSLNIGYNFPRKLTKRLNLAAVNFTVQMSDLFYVSTVKRERGTSYPFSFKPRFSLSITL